MHINPFYIQSQLIARKVSRSMNKQSCASNPAKIEKKSLVIFKIDSQKNQIN